MADTKSEHGNGTLAKLRKLLVHHDDAAQAIRTTLGLLNGHASQNGHASGSASVIADALALDTARRATKRKRRAMSAAEKKRVSIRMKQYWASKRKAKTKGVHA